MTIKYVMVHDIYDAKAVKEFMILASFHEHRNFFLHRVFPIRIKLVLVIPKREIIKKARESCVVARGRFQNC